MWRSVLEHISSYFPIRSYCSALNQFNRACTTIPIVETEDIYSLVVVHCYASKSKATNHFPKLL
jgi:hypothetical protein